MAKRYLVTLSEEERTALQKRVSSGKAAARLLTHARILLLADANDGGGGRTDQQVGDALGVGICTIERVRQRFVEEGLEAALKPRLHPPRLGKLSGAVEARVLALTKSDPPRGHQRWTLRLLADKLVELKWLERVSHESIRQVLKKNELKPWQEKTWCIPPKADAEFVYRMERLLELYRAPYDACRPIICMDEMSKQLIAETRRVLPVQEGQPKRFDYEYERKGVCQVLLFCEPLRGWRKGFVRQRRTMCDWAWCVRELLEVYYPEAACVRLVMDNLNTHTGASLYHTFAPADALRLLQRLEFYYTPKHGSWLNMAEIELSVLAKQCLDRRLEEQRCVAEEVSAWETQRNEQEAKVRWRFTVSDARVKLKKIYPSIEN